jgi:hypothetical protein
MTQLVARHYARPAARRHLWIGLAMAVVALAFGIEQAAIWLAAHPMAAQGLQASLFAGLATGLGALPLLFLRRPSERLMAPMLGLAGGMMLAASLFSLLVPAVQTVAASGSPWLLGIATAGACSPAPRRCSAWTAACRTSTSKPSSATAASLRSRWWSPRSRCTTCRKASPSASPGLPAPTTG